VHKFSPNFLQGDGKTPIATHDGWDKVSPMILAHKCMKKPDASITLFEEIAFNLLAKEHVLYRFQIHQLQSEELVTLQQIRIICVLLMSRLVKL
jgi:hypothetical protein